MGNKIDKLIQWILNIISKSVIRQTIVTFFFLYLLIQVTPTLIINGILNQYHLSISNSTKIVDNTEIASMHISVMNGLIIAFLTLIYVRLTGNLVKQSKKEQKIRDIENRLEKFYIPADEIINGQSKKNHEQTINGNSFGSGFDGLKHLRKYSYLADKTTYEAYDQYITTNCTVIKPTDCMSNRSIHCDHEKDFCRNNWNKCSHNLEYCEHYAECPQKDQSNVIIDNTKCKYYKALEEKITNDITKYKEELLRLKS